jgi:N-hydroxyarylamine O-acetyltransferase
MPCYCYEHNLLFKHALEALGFRVKGLLARVLDVGFGRITLTGPLRLIADIEQATRTNSSACREWMTNLSKR